MNISGIHSFNIQANAQSKQIKADKPYASLTAHDTTHFSGIIFSKEHREKTGQVVAQAQNTAEAGAKTAAVTSAATAAVPAAAVAIPASGIVVGIHKLFNGDDDYPEEQSEADRANGYADWR